MRRLGIIAILVVVASLILAACSSAAPAAPSNRGSESAKSASPSVSTSVAPAAAPAVAPGSGSGAAGNALDASGSGQSSADRMIIKNASLRLVVNDVDDVLKKAGKLATDLGGWVVSSDSQDRNGDRYGLATLRVPADKLDEAVNRIKEMAVRVTRDTSSSKDVTEEYSDQEARLKTLKVTEQTYLTLLQNAKTMEDIIKLQTSLQQTREQIEKSEGRMLYLKRNVETSTISLELTVPGSAKPTTVGGWTLNDTVSEALQSVVEAGTALVTMVIWVLVYTPIWLPIVLIIRWWRRRPRRRAAPPVPPAAPPVAPASPTA